jgi:hypothetical protein
MKVLPTEVPENTKEKIRSGFYIAMEWPQIQPNNVLLLGMYKC